MYDPYLKEKIAVSKKFNVKLSDVDVKLSDTLWIEDILYVNGKFVGYMEDLIEEGFFEN